MNLVLVDFNATLYEEIINFEIAANGSKVDGTLVWNASYGYEMIEINGTDEFLKWYDSGDKLPELVEILEEENNKLKKAGKYNV